MLEKLINELYNRISYNRQRVINAESDIKDSYEEIESRKDDLEIYQKEIVEYESIIELLKKEST